MPITSKKAQLPTTQPAHAKTGKDNTEVEDAAGEEEGEEDEEEEEDEENYPKLIWKPNPRPLSAYCYFCNSILEQVLAANPGAQVADTAAIMAQRWRDLSHEAKTPFVAMHNEAVAEYERKMHA